MVVCPNSGHPSPTSPFTKYKFLQVKYSFTTIVIELSVLKLFQLFNGDLLILYANSIYKVREPRITKLEQGVRSKGTLPATL